MFAGAAKALLLNQLSSEPPPAVSDTPGTRSGRRDAVVPRATSSTVAS